MKRATVDLLECPFCGGRLTIQPVPVAQVTDDEIDTGILSCSCCAYPVVDRIAYIRTGSRANLAMEHLGAGRREQALLTLLELDGERSEQFAAAVETDGTFRGLARILAGRDTEYLVYRFSDSTFICAAAIAGVLASATPFGAGPVLDFGGGAGHLARVLSRDGAGSNVVLADVSFWELWLAQRIVVPNAEFVCCDGNAPLPFREQSFSLVFSADAFHYVWSRRLLAAELARAVAAEGSIALCHLHNAEADNWSAGMPLSASGYRALFKKRPVRLFAERAVLSGIELGQVDLSSDPTDAALAGEAAFVLFSPADERLFRFHTMLAPRPTALAPNPLYRARTTRSAVVLRLRDVTEAYEGEFGDFRRYLPAEVRLPLNWRERFDLDDPEVVDLVRRRVLLDLPDCYG